jgi:mono/diheme cytochrome c family protein
MVRRFVVFAALLLALFAAIVFALNWRDEAAIPADATPAAGTPEQVAHGERLARIGNCATCHTVRGGVTYAGGRGIATPFGTVYAGNLTPDDATGLGRWSADHFWRALHNGRSADGRLLYPAFPYPDFTRVTRADSDAIYFYLRSLAPVRQTNRPHALQSPYDTQAAVAVWRALFFRPGTYEPDPTRTPLWNRGAYLVRGLGHCAACHGGRNFLGATPQGGMSLGGGLIPMLNWYAPALTAPDQAGLADWSEAEIVALLRDGTSARGSAIGPMADVVLRSTQHWAAQDLSAVATFLKSLPQQLPRKREVARADPAQLELGVRLYERHCAGCHGDDGRGATTRQGAPAHPALVGNRTVTMDPPANLVRAILHGGYLPATAGNPRPFGMPPFALVLNDAEVAAVATWLRQGWGRRAKAVTALEVTRHRGGLVD